MVKWSSALMQWHSILFINFEKRLDSYSYQIFSARSAMKVIRGWNKIHQITGKSLDHCSWHTSHYIWRGFEENEVEWTGKVESRKAEFLPAGGACLVSQWRGPADWLLTFHAQSTTKAMSAQNTSHQIATKRISPFTLCVTLRLKKPRKKKEVE